MCGNRHRSYCCPGWTVRPGTSLCVIRTYFAFFQLFNVLFHSLEPTNASYFMYFDVVAPNESDSLFQQFALDIVEVDDVYVPIFACAMVVRYPPRVTVYVSVIVYSLFFRLVTNLHPNDVLMASLELDKASP